jgi:hypothetical protein
MCQLDVSTCLSSSARSHQIRFRFDKSKHNCTIHKFRRQKTVQFDLIVAIELLIIALGDELRRDGHGEK